MKIVNGIIFNEDGRFEEKDLEFHKGVIGKQSVEKQEVYDAKGSYVLPGFIDIHIHGAMGVDFSDGNNDDLEKMAVYLLSKGVTAFLPTSMSYGEEVLTPAFRNAGKYIEERNENKKKADVLGIHMEGPFINPEKAGAQSLSQIRKPQMELFDSLWKESKGRIKLVDLAPEMDGVDLSMDEMIQRISKKCRVSIAHSNATFEEAKHAFKIGVSHVTHLFNGMSSFGHRDTGIVGAAIEDAKFVELICDGFHVHPNMIRTTFKLFGKDRICIVSDAIRAAGMKDGEYTLAGQKVMVSEGMAKLENGCLAGSVTNLLEELKNVILYGISMEEAVRAVTINPARAIGVFEKRGSLSLGKVADILIVDKKLKLIDVFKNGELVK